MSKPAIYFLTHCTQYRLSIGGGARGDHSEANFFFLDTYIPFPLRTRYAAFVVMLPVSSPKGDECGMLVSPAEPTVSQGQIGHWALSECRARKASSARAPLVDLCPVLSARPSEAVPAKRAMWDKPRLAISFRVILGRSLVRNVGGHLFVMRFVSSLSYYCCPGP